MSRNDFFKTGLFCKQIIKTGLGKIAGQEIKDCLLNLKSRQHASACSLNDLFFDITF